MIKIAFFAASPIKVTIAIWKYKSLLYPLKNVAISAPNAANGIARSTAKGSDHISYCAAKIKNTTKIPSNNTYEEDPLASFS